MTGLNPAEDRVCEIAIVRGRAGLIEADEAEIHLVINDHGPLIEGREFEMLNTYRDGCMDQSIPKPMPDAARVLIGPGESASTRMPFSPSSAAR